MGPANVQRLAHADLLVMLANVFSPPSAESTAEIAARGEALDEILGSAGDDPAGDLERAFTRLYRLVESAVTSEWVIEHNRLFESAVACPINEAGYVRRDKGAILADIAGFYRAFEMAAREGTGERLDHLVCELEFVTYLLVMLVRATEAGEDERAATTHDALASFAHDHLGEWLPAFCDRLTAQSDLSLYHAAAGALALLWRRILDHHQLPDARTGTPIAVEEDPGTPYECGLREAFEV